MGQRLRVGSAAEHEMGTVTPLGRAAMVEISAVRG